MMEKLLIFFDSRIVTHNAVHTRFALNWKEKAPGESIKVMRKRPWPGVS